ncbi:penicillin-binding protein [Klenkia taihuensis]|uniref:Membrane carboxypeptidase (Penicillin-binding protein) n=1 Tax=Klenkia taihuensis TaxID=1225127 RepID=A0A1I1NNF6_9ACTN|nr:transglycosylase domain-containing protein [Klenkia taihuensis]GHE11984.1 transglycosylase [Klenkia taihuensis]SFC96293.1 Membrane carboxypeptidase (penicillin-binding protein) [Klenkia taihuensis]
MSETRAPSRAATLAKLAATVVVAGALVAGMMLPFVGGSGLVARNSASLLDALPVELTDQTPVGMTTVLAADGSVITHFYENNRTPVTADQISPIMKQAIVDIEDSRFYEHNGLDVQGTLRALAANIAAGGVAEGGSTLTQQLVKQTLLQTADTPEEREAADEQTVGRKLREARLALALEETYSKDEILTRYLNIAYFGAGAYGIQAAAQRYFSVNAVDLDLAQASVLAGLVQSPTNDDPLANPENAQARRDTVLTRMHQLGHITDQELADTLAQPVATAEGQPPARNCTDASLGGFFCAYLQTHLLGLGMTQQQIDNGGYTIQTTLRPDMQAAGDQAVLNTLPMGDSLAGIYTAVEPGTGHVLAMSVNRQYCSDAANPACESVVLNTASSQGSGSTYKVFTAAAALEQGYSQYYTLTTGNSYTSRVFKNGSAPYRVSNAGTYPATLDMVRALYMSSNTYFVALEDALGSVEAPVRMAQRMGLSSIDANADQIIAEERGSFTLGAEATSPLALASAYSTLAASGTQCDPTPVVSIVDRNGAPATLPDGTVINTGDSCNAEAIPAGVANTLNQILRKDVEPGNSGQTGARAYVPGHQIAGKTGTSQSNFSAAFVGYTPEYTASVMVLNPKENQNVGGFGGNKPATIWNDAMEPILTAQETAPFPPADDTVANGNTRAVPGCSSVSECQSAITGAGLSYGGQVSVDSDQPAGTVLGTSPGTGTRVQQGGSVQVQVSNGSAAAPPAPTEGQPAPPADPDAPDTNGDGQPG